MKSCWALSNQRRLPVVVATWNIASQLFDFTILMGTCESSLSLACAIRLPPPLPPEHSFTKQAIVAVHAIASARSHTRRILHKLPRCLGRAITCSPYCLAASISITCSAPPRRTQNESALVVLLTIVTAFASGMTYCTCPRSASRQSIPSHLCLRAVP